MRSITFENARIGLSLAVMPQSSARTSTIRSDAAAALDADASAGAAITAFEIDKAANIADFTAELQLLRDTMVQSTLSDNEKKAVGDVRMPNADTSRGVGNEGRFCAVFGDYRVRRQSFADISAYAIRLYPLELSGHGYARSNRHPKCLGCYIFSAIH
jgi:hypothetical protein